MAAATFSEMKQTILNMTKRGSGALTDIGNSITSAIRFYERKPLWFNQTYTESLTLSTGSSSLSLPATFKKELMVRVQVSGLWSGESNGFKGKSFQELKANLFTDPTATGRPQYWAILGNTLYIDRIADTDYTIGLHYVYGDSSYPSADGDTSIWFDEARDLIRYYAAGLYYQDYLHAEEKAQTYFNKADSWINNLTIDFNTREAENELE